MKSYSFIAKKEDCHGCKTCEIACKQEHNLPVGPRWIRVYPDGPREIHGKLQLRYLVTHCMHCSRPPCKEACPVEAISQRNSEMRLVCE
jgi:Fe-S-cluster-containing dehydrogenase component